MTLGANGKLSASVKLASRGSWKASVTFRGNVSYVAATSASKAFSVK